jgi:ATP-dependent Clp protease protease subunit
MAKHSGKDVAQINKDTERDHYMTAAEAKDYGLIDSVIRNREEVLKDGKSKKKS